MTAYVRGALASLLSRYVLHLRDEDVRVSLWRGQVALERVVLDAAQLARLLPSVAVLRAEAASLALRVPWTRLLSRSVSVVGSGLRVALAPRGDAAAAPPAAVPVPALEPAAPPDPEAAELLWHLRRNVRVRLSDVEVSLAQPAGGPPLVVSAEQLSTGPQRGAAGVVQEEDDEDDFEADGLPLDDGQGSRFVVFQGLTVRLADRVLLRPVSARAELYLNGSQLSHCHLVLTEELRLCLSDIDIATVETLLGVLLAPVARRMRPPAPAPSAPVMAVSSEDLALPKRAVSSPLSSAAETETDVTPPTSWTTALLSYGKAWIFGSQAGPAAPSTPSRQRSPPRRAGSVPSAEDVAAVQPSWFRLEVPVFAVELYRFVEVACARDGSVHVVPRRLLDLQLGETWVEWCHSVVALELVARVGTVASRNLWSDEPLLTCQPAGDVAGAVVVDWVHGLAQRAVEVTVEPVAVHLTAALTRELALFASNVTTREVADATTAAAAADNDGTDARNVGTEVAVAVEFRRPRLRLGATEAEAERVVFAGGRIRAEGLSVAAWASGTLILEPVPAVCVDLYPDVTVRSEGTVSVALVAADVDVLVEELSAFGSDVSDELPDYRSAREDGALSSFTARLDPQELAFVRSMMRQRLARRRRGAEDGSRVVVELPRVRVRVVDERKAPVADLLLDSVEARSVPAGVRASVAGFMLVDRAVEGSERVLLANQAIDDGGTALSARAYAELAEAAFAPDVLFASPAYKSRARGACPVEIAARWERDAADSVPRPTVAVRSSGVFVWLDVSAFSRIAEALARPAGAEGRSTPVAPLMWRYVAARALRLRRRLLLHALAEGHDAGLPLVGHDSWQSFARQEAWRLSGVRPELAWRAVLRPLQRAAVDVAVDGVCLETDRQLKLQVGSIAWKTSFSRGESPFGGLGAAGRVSDVRVSLDSAVVLEAEDSVLEGRLFLRGGYSLTAAITSVSARLVDTPQLGNFVNVVRDAWGVPSRATRTSGSSRSSSSLVVALAAASCEVAGFRVTLVAPEMTFAGSVLAQARAAGVSFEHDGRVLVGVPSVKYRAPGCVAVRGARVTLWRESWDALAAALHSVRGILRGGEAAKVPLAVEPAPGLEFVLRDASVSLPLGRQSALHLKLGRLSGSHRALRAKGLAVYFGSQSMLDAAVGGCLRLDSLSLGFESSGEVDVVLGAVALTLSPADDLEHVCFLLRHISVSPANGVVQVVADAPASPWRLRRLECAEIQVASSGGLLVLQGPSLERAPRWVAAIPAVSVVVGDVQALQLRNTRLTEDRMVMSDGISMTTTIAMASTAGVSVAAVSEAMSRLREALTGRGASAEPVAQSATQGSVTWPEIAGVDVPSVALYVVPGAGQRPIARLLAERVTLVNVDGAGSFRAAVQRTSGFVRDTLGTSELPFIEADGLRVAVQVPDVEVAVDETVRCWLSEPLSRLVTALRLGDTAPLFPIQVENLLGWTVIIGTGTPIAAGGVGSVASGPQRLQVLHGPYCWGSAGAVDLAAVDGSVMVELEAGGGDAPDLLLTRVSRDRIAVAGSVVVANATGVPVEVLHYRSLVGSELVFSEHVAADGLQRRAYLTSDKGKEEADAEDVNGGAVRTGVGAALTLVQLLATPRSRLRFRVAPAKWSSAWVGTDPRGASRKLIQCAPDVYAWVSAFSSGRQVTVRLCPVCVMENRLPCALFWAGASAAGCVAAGHNATYLGRPEDLSFGFSVLSADEALHRRKTQPVDGLKPRGHVGQVLVTAFSVPSTSVRMVQVACATVLINTTGQALLFSQTEADGSVSSSAWVAPGVSYPCASSVNTVCGARFLDDAGLAEADERHGALAVHWDSLEGGVERTHSAFVSVWRDRVTRSLHVEVCPRYFVLNGTESGLAVQGGPANGNVLVVPARASVPLPLWLEDEPQLRLRAFPEDEGWSAPLVASFGRTFVVRLAGHRLVIVSVRFRPSDVGFPRPVLVSVMEESAPVLAVRNLTPWTLAVQEQWEAEAPAIVPPGGGAVPLCPRFWRNYVERQGETMDEALARLDGDGKKGRPASPDGDVGATPYPLSVRCKAFVFRVRVVPSGSWSEPLEASRPRCFSVPLYTEGGAAAVSVNVVFRGATKEIVLGGPDLPVAAVRPGSFQLRLNELVVRAEWLVEAAFRDITVVRRGIVVEADFGEVRVANLIPSAVYPVLLQWPQRGGRALAVRARLGAVPGTSPLARLTLVPADGCLELDSASVAQLALGLKAMFAAGAPSSSAPSPGHPPRAWLDDLDVGGFGVVLTWQDPTALLPVPVWDSVLTVRRLRLDIVPLAHSGCALFGRDVGTLARRHLGEALVGQTVRVLGSLDVLGNPTGLVAAVAASARSLRRTGAAAVAGDAHGALEGAADAARALAAAVLTPVASLSAASSRLIGSEGALGAAVDGGRRALEVLNAMLLGDE